MKSKPLIPWQNIPEDLDPFVGFVYLIENLTNGRKYVGRKYLWSVRRTKVEGKKRRKVVRKESDWRTYTGSCDELNADISKLGIDKFKFTILSFHETQGRTNYYEGKEQFIRDVLHATNETGDYIYYNTNILNRYYRGRI